MISLDFASYFKRPNFRFNWKFLVLVELLEFTLPYIVLYSALATYVFFWVLNKYELCTTRHYLSYGCFSRYELEPNCSLVLQTMGYSATIFRAVEHLVELSQAHHVRD